MLQKMWVDGFRSLVDFSISLEPGLNVIVGSNGTGKTNFVSFLDFIAEMVENDLNAAISVAHGAGAVFSKEKFQADSAELEFDLSGTIEVKKIKDSLFYFSGAVLQENERGTYSYRVKIIYLKDVPAVLIGEEELCICVEGQEKLFIKRRTDRLKSTFKSQLDILPSNHIFVSDMYSWNKNVREEKKSLSSLLASRLAPERSFLHYFMGHVASITSVMADLTSLRSVNIDPSLARRPSPVGVRQDIGPTGEGLAGALYRLRNGNYNASHGSRFNTAFMTAARQEAIHKSILSWCREINSEVQDINVNLDFHEALLRPNIRLKRNKKVEEFSLNRISDGTVKWLALLAILHVEPSLSVIEEPENFLHPFMQESFVALCRRLVSEDPIRNLIISTHSPTLLDCCKPGELTIFEIREGISRASKVFNATQLNEKIKTSRFGLGYYYRTGGVYGADRSDS